MFIFSSVKFLTKWSLELSGGSIIWYNEYLSENKRQILRGVYYACSNTVRGVRFLYQTASSYAQIIGDAVDHTSENYQQRIHRFNQLTAQRLHDLCEFNSGVYARIGQSLSQMNQIIPNAYSQALSSISSINQHPMNYQEVKNILEKHFGKPMKDVFDLFRIEPLSTGIVSQVYKAELLQNFKTVLIKLKLPYIEAQYKYDLWFINKSLKMIVPYLKKKNFKQQQIEIFISMIKKVEESVQAELNFENEIANANLIKEETKDMSNIYVPYYYQQYCNANIILREYINGVKLTDLNGLKEIGLKPKAAFSYFGSAIMNVVSKCGLINTSIDEESVVLRKYLPPPLPLQDSSDKNHSLPTVNLISTLKTQKQRLLPKYQVVLLDQQHYEKVTTEVGSLFANFWNSFQHSRKQFAKKYTFSADSLYKSYLQLKKVAMNSNEKVTIDASTVLNEKLYGYQSFLDFYQKVVNSVSPSQKSKNVV